MCHARDTASAEHRPMVAHPALSGEAAAPYLGMKGIVKRYGAVTALDKVDLTVNSSEIHALLGENGAGKSTLMQVLTGLTQPDAGIISLADRRVRVDMPRTARALGIAMVHQHFTLVPAFTVEENLALDMHVAKGEQNRRAGYSAASSAAPALQRAADLGWKLDPKARVGDLSVGAQQRVEIVKALATNARLLIFDEPTAVLIGDEVDELFQVLRRLRDEGCTVILIAHKLAEILAVADRVTVLRRGKVVAIAPIAETDAPQLAQWMVGEEGVGGVPGEKKEKGVGEGRWTIVESGNTRHSIPDTRHPILFTSDQIVVDGDRGEQAVCGVSFMVRSGEIFGIGGVDGNGQTELAEALVGLRPLADGTIQWKDDRFVPGATPRIGYIPQDRRRSGLAVTMSIEDNLLWDAVRDPQYRRGPFLRRKALHEMAESLRQQFDIRAPSVTLPASALSGGNQQKIVVARAFHAHPEWIVAVNPTRGLDIGATRFVHDQLRQARARGAAITLISTDLDELTALADRSAILSGGQLAEFAAGTADNTQIGLLLGGLGTAIPGQETI